MQEPLGGLPARAALHETGLYLVLRAIEAAELRDPFMQQTIDRLSVEETIVHVPRADVGSDAAGTAPTGMIFHVGRCGSTLISQALKRLDNIAVYSEPLPVNEILTLPHKWPRMEIVGALRSLGVAFAAHARGPYVIKFSSWNTLFCDILAAAFPETPWIFNIRDPAEVGVSLMSQPSGWVKTNSDPVAREIAKLVDPSDSSASREEYIARLYGALCDAVGGLDPVRGRLLDYEALPAALSEIVAPHFGLGSNEDVRRRMLEAARLNAKSPVSAAAPFTPDSVRKRAAASAELRQELDTYARPALQRLQRAFAR